MTRSRLLARTLLKSGEVWFEAFRRAEAFILHWPRAATIRLSSDGRRMVFLPTPRAARISIAVLRHIGSAYQDSLKGKDALHATALYRRRVVIGLMAPPGEGKTTLAAHLIGNGWTCLGDDIVLPVFRGRSVWPAQRPSFLKTATRPRGNGTSWLSISYDPNLEKYVKRISPQRSPGPIVALIRLYRTTRGRIRARRLSPAQAVPHLMANVYNDLLRTSHMRRRQFEWAVQIASRVPVWTLHFPTGKRHLRRAEAAALRIRMESTA